MLHITVSEQDNLLNSEELCLCCNIDDTVLHQLVEHSITIPIGGEVIEEWQFTLSAVSLAKKATRIQRDLSMDWAGIALILELLDERDKLSAQVYNLQQQLKRFKYLE